MLHNQNVDATVWPTFEFSDGVNASTVLEVDPVRNELLDAATTVGSSSAARRMVCACLDGCAARVCACVCRWMATRAFCSMTAP